MYVLLCHQIPRGGGREGVGGKGGEEEVEGGSSSTKQWLTLMLIFPSPSRFWVSVCSLSISSTLNMLSSLVVTYIEEILCEGGH